MPVPSRRGVGAVIGADGMAATQRVLTPRERQVAEHVALGWRNRQIAEALGITERTVKKHVSAACEKCRVRGRVQLALEVTNRVRR